MSEARVDLIFEGQLAPGYEQDDVRQTLKALFEFDTEMQNDLFSGRPVLLGENMDAATAGAFRQALAGAGAVTRLVTTGRAGESTMDKRSGNRRVPGARRARLRSSAILPDRRQGGDRRS